MMGDGIFTDGIKASYQNGYVGPFQFEGLAINLASMCVCQCDGDNQYRPKSQYPKAKL